jgi:hypothetical protein
VVRKPGDVCGGGSSTTAGTNCEKDPGLIITNLFKATHLDGLTAVAQGDSGGGVFAFHTDGTAIARGMNSGHEPPVVTCPTDHRVPKGFWCSAGMNFVNISTIEKNQKLTVTTSKWPQ